MTVVFIITRLQSGDLHIFARRCRCDQACDLDETSDLARTLTTVDLVATSIFVVEMLAKIIHLGLLWTPNAYLSTAWNRLDGFIVTASIISIFGSGSPAFRVLRVLRVLRPLRLISRFEGMRLAVTLLFKVMPKVFDVLLIYVVFLDVFAILGVQLFAGKFAACDGADLPSKAACEAAGYAWVNPSWGSFDNVFAASLLLFEMSSLEGWPTVLYAVKPRVCYTHYVGHVCSTLHVLFITIITRHIRASTRPRLRWLPCATRRRCSRSTLWGGLHLGPTAF